jgi:hypothetical protein
MWPEWSCACKCLSRRALSSPHRWALYVAGMLMVLYGLYLISIDSARISVMSSVVGGGGGGRLDAAGGAKMSGGAQIEIAQEEPFTGGFARRRLRFEGEAVMGEAVKATASEGAALPDGAVLGAEDETDPERTISNSSTSSESTATASTTTLSEALAAALPLKVIVPTATSPSVSRLGSFHGLSQRTDRENVRDIVRDKSLSRNPTPSELIHELLHNPAPSLLPSPFTVYGMASGEGRSPSSGHLGTSRVISGHLGSSRSPSSGHLGTSRVISGHLGSSRSPSSGRKPNESAAVERLWGDGGAAALEPNTALEPANRTDRTEPTESSTFSAMVTSMPSSTSSNGSKDSSNGPNDVTKDSSKSARGGAPRGGTLLAGVLGWGSKRATSSTRDPSRDWGDLSKSGGRATNTALFTVSEYERKGRVGRSAELNA